MNHSHPRRAYSLGVPIVSFCPDRFHLMRFATMIFSGSQSFGFLYVMACSPASMRSWQTEQPRTALMRFRLLQCGQRLFAMILAPSEVVARHRPLASRTVGPRHRESPILESPPVEHDG